MNIRLNISCLKKNKAINITLTTMFFVMLSVVMHQKSLSLWWTFDDPYLLELVIHENIFSFIWNYEVYHKFSMANFTPLQMFSYAFDYAVFGFNPTGFYFHQIIVLGVIAEGIFLLVRRWNFWAAVCGGMIFLLSAPATFGSQVLMTRHYLEGGMWSIIAVLLLFSAEKPGTKTILAGLSYLMAALYKEVYIPLAVAVPFFLNGTWERKMKMVFPFWIGLAVYIPWRLFMLRRFGGYGDDIIEFKMNIALILDGIKHILSILWGNPFQHGAWIIILCLTAACIVILKHKFGGILILLIGAIASILPLLPAVKIENFLSYRFIIHISMIWTIGFGFAVSKLVNINIFSKSCLKILLFFAVFGMIIVMWQEKQTLAIQQLKMIQPHMLEYKFFFDESHDKTLVVSTIGHHWQALTNIRNELKQDKSLPPEVCQMPFDLREHVDTKYFKWSAELNNFMDVTYLCQEEIKQFKNSISYALPQSFSIDIEIFPGSYDIQINKGNCEGEYYLLIGKSPNIYESFIRIPCSFSGKLYAVPHLFFIRIVKKDSEDKYVISKEWGVRLNGEYRISWPEEME